MGLWLHHWMAQRGTCFIVQNPHIIPSHCFCAPAAAPTLQKQLKSREAEMEELRRQLQEKEEQVRKQKVSWSPLVACDAVHGMSVCCQ